MGHKQHPFNKIQITNNPESSIPSKRNSVEVTHHTILPLSRTFTSRTHPRLSNRSSWLLLLNISTWSKSDKPPYRGRTQLRQTPLRFLESSPHCWQAWFVQLVQMPIFKIKRQNNEGVHHSLRISKSKNPKNLPVVSLRTVHRANWPVVRMIFSALSAI